MTHVVFAWTTTGTLLGISTRILVNACTRPGLSLLWKQQNIVRKNRKRALPRDVEVAQQSQSASAKSNGNHISSPCRPSTSIHRFISRSPRKTMHGNRHRRSLNTCCQLGVLTKTMRCSAAPRSSSFSCILLRGGLLRCVECASSLYAEIANLRIK